MPLAECPRANAFILSCPFVSRGAFSLRVMSPRNTWQHILADAGTVSRAISSPDPAWIATQTSARDQLVSSLRNALPRFVSEIAVHDGREASTVARHMMSSSTSRLPVADKLVVERSVSRDTDFSRS